MCYVWQALRGGKAKGLYSSLAAQWSQAWRVCLGIHWSYREEDGILVFSKWQTLLAKRRKANTYCSFPEFLTRQSWVKDWKRNEQFFPRDNWNGLCCFIIYIKKFAPNWHPQNYALNISKEKSHYPTWFLETLIIFVISSGIWVLGFNLKLESPKKKIMFIGFFLSESWSYTQLSF